MPVAGSGSEPAPGGGSTRFATPPPSCPRRRPSQAGGTAVEGRRPSVGVYCGVVCKLGSRLHPITHVQAEYVLCEYLTGEAQNMDVLENTNVVWAEKIKLTSSSRRIESFRPYWKPWRCRNDRICGSRQEKVDCFSHYRA
jgi:hypothetical protein